MDSLKSELVDAVVSALQQATDAEVLADISAGSPRRDVSACAQLVTSQARRGSGLGL